MADVRPRGPFDHHTEVTFGLPSWALDYHPWVRVPSSSGHRVGFVRPPSFLRSRRKETEEQEKSGSSPTY